MSNSGFGRPNELPDITSGSELESLRAELEDLRILYQATIEHGEAVEDQLAEINIELQKTQLRLSEELSEAANYVMSILPEPRTSTPSTEWLLVPSTELGGDSFGYHDIDTENIAFYLLDVCGHGIGAALLSVAAINVLRSSALRNTDFTDPGAVLSALNEAFPMEKHNNMYFTIWYGVYNRKTAVLSYSSAGHPPAVLQNAKGELDELATPAVAIGMFPEVTYVSRSISIGVGDRLAIISDGTFEISTSSGKMLEFDEFTERLKTNGSPSEVLSWIQDLNGPGPLPDDFSFLSVKF